MKYVYQFSLILGISFLGEALHALLPVPIPASIYGLLLLFVLLILRVIKVDDLKETGNFLTTLLPLLFVSPVVSLLDCWEQMSGHLIPIITIMVASTLITFGVSGKVTQMMINRQGIEKDDR